MAALLTPPGTIDRAAPRVSVSEDGAKARWSATVVERLLALLCEPQAPEMGEALEVMQQGFHTIQMLSATAHSGLRGEVTRDTLRQEYHSLENDFSDWAERYKAVRRTAPSGPSGEKARARSVMAQVLVKCSRSSDNVPASLEEVQRVLDHLDADDYEAMAYAGDVGGGLAADFENIIVDKRVGKVCYHAIVRKQRESSLNDSLSPVPCLGTTTPPKLNKEHPVSNELDVYNSIEHADGQADASGGSPEPVITSASHSPATGAEDDVDDASARVDRISLGGVQSPPPRSEASSMAPRNTMGTKNRVSRGVMKPSACGSRSRLGQHVNTSPGRSSRSANTSARGATCRARHSVLLPARNDSETASTEAQGTQDELEEDQLAGDDHSITNSHSRTLLSDTTGGTSAIDWEGNSEEPHNNRQQTLSAPNNGTPGTARIRLTAQESIDIAEEVAKAIAQIEPSGQLPPIQKNRSQFPPIQKNRIIKLLQDLLGGWKGRKSLEVLEASYHERELIGLAIIDPAPAKLNEQQGTLWEEMWRQVERRERGRGVTELEAKVHAVQWARQWDKLSRACQDAYWSEVRKRCSDQPWSSWRSKARKPRSKLERDIENWIRHSRRLRDIVDATRSPGILALMVDSMTTDLSAAGARIGAVLGQLCDKKPALRKFFQALERRYVEPVLSGGTIRTHDSLRRIYPDTTESLSQYVFLSDGDDNADSEAGDVSIGDDDFVPMDVDEEGSAGGYPRNGIPIPSGLFRDGSPQSVISVDEADSGRH